MNAIERAWLYVSRKRARTAILFAILAVIATALLIAQSAVGANREALERAAGDIGTSFTYTAGPGEKPLIAEEETTEVARLSGIAGSSRYLDATAVPVGLSLLEPATGSGAAGGDASTRVTGTSDSETAPLFTSGQLRLTTGRSIVEQDRAVAMVHEAFAERNGLGLGSQVRLTGSTGAPQTLTVVGLFSGQDAEGMQRASELLQNRILADLPSVQDLAGLAGSVSEANYLVAEDADRDDVLAQARALAAANHRVVQDDGAGRAEATSALEGAHRMMTAMLLGLSLLSGVVLTLVLFFWIQERMHEAGIMMSVGITRRGILAQYAAEVLMIVGVSFAPAAIAVGIVAGLAPGAILLTLLLLAVIAVSSISVATAAALRLKPKDILSRLS